MSSFPYILLAFFLVELIVLLLVIPFVIKYVESNSLLWLLILLIIYFVLILFVQKKSFAIWFNYFGQIALIGLGFYKAEIGVIGVIFLVSLIFVYYLGKKANSFYLKNLEKVES